MCSRVKIVEFIDSNEMKRCIFLCEAYSEKRRKNNVQCVAQDCCPDQETFFKSDPDYLKYPEYASLRRCTITVGLSLACMCVCVLFYHIPAELLLFFLPPRPKADSFLKQALSLPSDGERAL